MNSASVLPLLLGLAWLLPLASFTLIVLFGPGLGRDGKQAAYVATAAIGIGFLLSAFCLFGVWLPSHPLVAGHATTMALHEESPADPPHSGLEVHAKETTVNHVHTSQSPPHYAGEWYTLCQVGTLKLTIGYYIDTLTLVMFCMVTLIATCIHFYSMGYMHEELHDVTDHEVTLEGGEHLRRPGRYHRFFQYLSLFCFSMLGLVIAGNILMVFVFWELVGICSYFLIGFYIERSTASTAANKAFIVNRVGDFGMLIGLMVVWAGLGTFAFGDVVGDHGQLQPGIFSQIRPKTADHRLTTPDGMVWLATNREIGMIREEFRHRPGGEAAAEAEIALRTEDWRSEGFGYGLLVVAGLGIFCGCVGKSAQFPLHTWLPDAMEGPTPVSALVHSATMVAAGVYLVGRFYPVFTPEVLLVIAYVGCVTLLIAATIAVTATDIKRVLAYSTISQLGYMMLALGVGGWVAGMFHLVTHAFFKSLLFLCSGSVIHAVHTNEMTDMGGLRKRMPWTAYTMLVGCLAIIGAGVPFVVGFSGFHSKDSIIEQVRNFANANPVHEVLFLSAVGGAILTAFYMFRLWYLTFTGQPRNDHRYEHSHESPQVMVVPLVVLAVFSIGVGWRLPGTELSITNLFEQARPAGTLETVEGGLLLTDHIVPNEHHSHRDIVRRPATWAAFLSAAMGLGLATCIYLLKWLDPNEVSQQFRRLYRFLIHKWWFDELYNFLFVQPVLILSRAVAGVDRKIIDKAVDGVAKITCWLSRLEDKILDRFVIDGFVNAFADKTWRLAIFLRNVQTGKLRQYVMLLVVATIVLFLLVTFVWNYALAG